MVMLMVLQSLLQDMESRKPQLDEVLITANQIQQGPDSETDKAAVREKGQYPTLTFHLFFFFFFFFFFFLKTKKKRF
jgi:hypothetical protein